MATASSGAPPPAAGIIDSVRSFLASWLALARTRVEMIGVEIEEQREWLEELILLAVAAAFCLSLGVILLTLLVVVLFWDKHPVAVLAAFTVLYLGGGAGLWAALRRKLKNKPRLFAATAAELSKDYAALQPRSP